jgi:hypothetical protein
LRTLIMCLPTLSLLAKSWKLRIITTPMPTFYGSIGLFH